MWGVTYLIVIGGAKDGISIHTPRVGRDRFMAAAQTDFGAFQSTRPVWGVTAREELDKMLNIEFQSTRPVWGVTRSSCAAIFDCSISIHTPRVGRDSDCVEKRAFDEGFQSTRPVWGVT